MERPLGLGGQKEGLGYANRTRRSVTYGQSHAHRVRTCTVKSFGLVMCTGHMAVACSNTQKLPIAHSLIFVSSFL